MNENKLVFHISEDDSEIEFANYILRILHFATKPCNFTSFKMLFPVALLT